METATKQQTETTIDVHIFATTLTTKFDVDHVAKYFDNHTGVLRWSVDLDDWERVLKVVATPELHEDEIISTLEMHGYEIAELGG